MRAGCHVLSEVPGAYTQEECMNLRQAVEYTGKTYMLGEIPAIGIFSAISASGLPKTDLALFPLPKANIFTICRARLFSPR